jgi:hypothetical protein
VTVTASATGPVTVYATGCASLLEPVADAVTVTYQVFGSSTDSQTVTYVVIGATTDQLRITYVIESSIRMRPGAVLHANSTTGVTTTTTVSATTSGAVRVIAPTASGSIQYRNPVRVKP